MVLQQVQGSSTHHETITGGGGAQQTGFGQQSPAIAVGKTENDAVHKSNAHTIRLSILDSQVT